MFTIVKKTLNWGGRPLTIETGKVARQADGAVVVTYGETQVLATACAKKTPMVGIDFLPLTVAYTEKFYAAGKIPGGYLKRESRPSDKETLTSRLIDRPIRPLFNPYYTNDTQVLLTVLSHDMENDPDVVAIVAASAALSISGIPLLAPVGGARVGYVDGAFVLNPVLSQRTSFALDLVVAGTSEGVLMVESEAHELSEQIMLDAVMFGHEAYQPVIDLIAELVRDVGKPRWEVSTPDASYNTLQGQIKDLISKDLESAFALKDKQPRQQALLATKEKMLSSLGADEAGTDLVYGEKIFKDLGKDIVRGAILDKRPRLDGRAMDSVRSIVAEVGGVPRAHGSALFTRGETQALVVTTLGTGDDEQMIDGLEGTVKERFMLHYNFPPYSVGEVSPLRAPGRREIGHGKLAWRAINPLLPSAEDCPYTLRIVSEITESNGSSSMATVCGASLSLMDAGIPLSAPVAGIAMGLIKEGERFVVLSDILGDEDHLGDMDFKVAGTEKGITALQMDIKITSITKDIMGIALEQARHGRLHILGEMAKAISSARLAVSTYAPQMQTLQIPKDKIREVIGTGGKVIREITAVSGAKIDIEEDGTIRIFSPNAQSIETALSMIRDIVAVPEIGHLYTGPVVGIKEFGAFVRFLGSLDGLVHISEISDERINSVEDKLKVGDIVTVKLLAVDERGKYKLSIKQAK